MQLQLLPCLLWVGSSWHQPTATDRHTRHPALVDTPPRAVGSITLPTPPRKGRRLRLPAPAISTSQHPPAILSWSSKTSSG